jgi:methyltransferase-like protein/2-polyprenyl-3-methyl-5-hydroxy-6-metoxy-1,4-benzoquinol methylase
MTSSSPSSPRIPKAPAGGTATNDYDAVPYPSFSYTQTHPDVMATLARLLGMQAAPVEHCRVLEIGCASGGNLIPMADGLPGSEFVGIDLSVRQIETGRDAINAMGLTNIRLQRMDIREISPSFGEFDYIIAHGIYSWVPPDVREHLMRLCSYNLAPNGLAYISYNTYPGWHMLGSIREMLLYRTRKVNNPLEKAAQAKQFLKFLTEAIGGKQAPTQQIMKGYLSFLERELAHLDESSDAYLLHDELERVNDPVFFHQFAAHAAQHNLLYVTDADFRVSMPHNLPPEAGDALRAIAGDLVEMEQYIDFVNNRSFRRSLLCHRAVNLRRTLTPTSVYSLYASSRAQPESTPIDVDTQSVARFKDSEGATFATDHPVSKAALLLLIANRPRAIAFNELLDEARARVKGNSNSRERDAEVLGVNLLRAFTYSGTLVNLHTYVPPVTSQPSEKPVASRIARYQAPSMDRVTNAYHERIKLEPFGIFLTPYLDGTRDRAALNDLLLNGPIARGELSVQREGQAVTDPQGIRSALAEEVDELLRWLAFAGVLIG